MAQLHGQRRERRTIPKSAVLISALALLLAACEREADSATPEIRPVRAVTVEQRQSGVPVILTGRIEADDEAAFGFRTAGRIINNDLNLGDRIEPGQITGRIETDTVPTIEIPSTAVVERNRQTAVWIVNPSRLTVSARDIEVLNKDPVAVVVSKGLDPDDVVVTAGARSLQPGQLIRLLGSEP
jgi:multidrug efflux pump subunit AcrA (membrane-fusion protein)